MKDAENEILGSLDAHMVPPVSHFILLAGISLYLESIFGKSRGRSQQRTNDTDASLAGRMMDDRRSHIVNILPTYIPYFVFF